MEMYWMQKKYYVRPMLLDPVCVAYWSGRVLYRSECEGRREWATGQQRRSRGLDEKVGSCGSCLLWILQQLTSQIKYWKCSERPKFLQSLKSAKVSPLLGLSLVHSSERTGSFRFLLEELNILNIIKNLIGPGAGSVTKPKLSSICDVKSHILVATSP